MISAYRSMLDRISLRIAVEPTVEQVTLDQAYAHLRLDAYGSPLEHPDDQWLLDNIATAREWCEFWSGHALAPQVLELAIGRFPACGDYYGYCSYGYWPWSWSPVGLPHTDAIRLPMSPIAGIESIVYVDTTGVTQTLDSAQYVLDNYAEPGWVYPVFGGSWPATQAQPNAAIIRYHAGYTLPSDSPNDFPIPRRYRSAMLLVLGHLYENRENTSFQYKVEDIPLNAQALMERGRIRLGMA